MAADQNPSGSTAPEEASKQPSKELKKKEGREEGRGSGDHLSYPLRIHEIYLFRFRVQSDEDLALKQQLELYVERVQDADPGIQKFALESMRQEIRTATSSMTSVPKPLKFLRPHYGDLKAYFETMPESDLKKYLADILSVLALTMSAEGERESLKYRLLGSETDIGSWGHEYVRLYTRLLACLPTFGLLNNQVESAGENEDSMDECVEGVTPQISHIT
ncbi:hypothetical protein HPP92_006718 [Vanilla planifolia]|uniref:RPN1 N-terminal domain-containing protein n=1 Tax=Vanilla planifolia TaxID=51239 RepID=A0A835RKZ1_VANPL|nr:hypothetical protein HPP92_006718 [Vanilla planifolia]